MRCLTVFALIALIAVLALTGYNHWRIGQIYNDLNTVKTRLHINEPISAGEPTNLADALNQAEQHAQQARKLLSKGKNNAARLELDKSLRKLEKAGELSREIPESSSLDKTLSTVQKQIQGTLEGLSKEAIRQKSKSKESGNNE
jgi:hypothetical protein